MLAVVSHLEGAVLPAGTDLEVRLSAATGSRISHPGDSVEATVIAPVFEHGRLLIPQGATISGAVGTVDRLGMGIRHRVAALQYHFDSIDLPDGQSLSIGTRLVEVETARERVRMDGTVEGIFPAANLSSSVSFLVPALCVEPGLAVPILGIKFLIARSPDAEIYFPAGTELILQLTDSLTVAADEATSRQVPALSTDEVAKAEELLAGLPQQQTNGKHNQPSDLVNLLFLGTRDQIERAFRAAGWLGAQERSAVSIYRMFHCLVQRMGYGTAPMAQLTLNGIRSDANFQKSLDTFSKRHHLRLWKQEHSDAWLGAAIEDVAIVIREMHVTHGTNREIDNERAKVVNDIVFTGCVDAGALIPREFLETSSQNGTAIETDGKVAALRLNDCRNPRTMPAVQGRADPGPQAHMERALVALRNDIIRSNPVALGYNTVKTLHERSISATRDSNALADSSQQKSAQSEAPAQASWIRPTVLVTAQMSGHEQPVSIGTVAKRGI